MAVQPAGNYHMDHDSSRLVWVLNKDTRDYTEEFRGKMLTIPSDEQKIAKRVQDGGNLMGFLEARRFLGQPKIPSDIKVDGTYDIPPKKLYTQELTEDEFNKIHGVKAPKKKSGPKEYVCHLDGKVFTTQAALDRHMAKNYPYDTPLEDESA